MTRAAGFMAARSGPDYPPRLLDEFPGVCDADGEQGSTGHYPVLRISSAWELWSMLGVTVPGVQDRYEASDATGKVPPGCGTASWPPTEPTSLSLLTAVSSSRAGNGGQPSRPQADTAAARPPHGEVTVELSAYQQAAGETSQLRPGGPQGAIAPMLGLASETGSILGVYKKYLRDGIGLAANRDFLREELGDLLWYTAAVATACGLDLEEVAAANLCRARDRYPRQRSEPPWGDLPVLDAGYPARERFPRRLVVAFTERVLPSGRRAASLTLVRAEPNAFPDGPVTVAGKTAGFGVGAELGDPLTDNSRRADTYRFHDGIHLGFMAVLGWSPTTRALLRIKRKSSPGADECEDGARAILAEEGLAAVLSRLAGSRTGFLSETSIDGDVIEVAKAAAADLEVESTPAWAWRSAIHQGFRAMYLLGENRGGYLVADLDKRELLYQMVLSS